MECKKCGKTIIGSPQRYCSACKRKLRASSKNSETTNENICEPVQTERMSIETFRRTKEIKVEEVMIEEKEKIIENEKKISKQEEKVLKKEEIKREKKSKVFTLGYFLFIIIIMLAVLAGSYMLGIAIGPYLPI